MIKVKSEKKEKCHFAIVDFFKLKKLQNVTFLKIFKFVIEL